MTATTKEIDDYLIAEASRHDSENHNTASCSSCQQIKQAMVSIQLRQFAIDQTGYWIEDINKAPNLESLICSIVANTFTFGIIAGVAISEKRELERIVSGQHS